MDILHFYPIGSRSHKTNGGADCCWCEPEIVKFHFFIILVHSGCEHLTLHDMSRVEIIDG